MHGISCFLLPVADSCRWDDSSRVSSSQRRLDERGGTQGTARRWATSNQGQLTCLFPHPPSDWSKRLDSEWGSPPFPQPGTKKSSRWVRIGRLGSCTARPTTRNYCATSQPHKNPAGDSKNNISCGSDYRPRVRPPDGICQKAYYYRGFRCTYWVKYAEQPPVSNTPAIVCIHGFGAGAFHWEKMMSRASHAGHDIFALDLIGFGDADMPPPADTSSTFSDVFQYTFESWSEQILHFLHQVLPNESASSIESNRKVILTANSIGCVIALQTAYSALIRRRDDHKADMISIVGVMCLNPSLRQLHFRKRRGLSRWTTPLSLRVLRFRPLAHFFFNWVRRPETLRRLLISAYAVTGAKAEEVITTELVERIRTPSLRNEALDVFLAFTSYDRGPLAEELVEQIRQTASEEQLDRPQIWVLWGERDPWEPFHVGKALFADNPNVDRFVELKSLGHCPHDQAPDTVMQYVHEFVLSLELCDDRK